MGAQCGSGFFYSGLGYLQYVYLLRWIWFWLIGQIFADFAEVSLI